MLSHCLAALFYCAKPGTFINLSALSYSSLLLFQKKERREQQKKNTEHVTVAAGLLYLAVTVDS